MAINKLLKKLKTAADAVEFDEVITAITEQYDYTPTTFTNGVVINQAGSNEGSCKIFAFAKINDLSEAQTLACFGRYYRHEVLNNPQGSENANIRQFMQRGWLGIQFEHDALTIK